MIRRFLTGRTSSKGCVKSATRVTARRWMRYTMRMNGRTSIAACCALRIFDAATICMALVICAVLLIDLMRRRISRVLATGSAPERLERGGCRLQRVHEVVAQRIRRPAWRRPCRTSPPARHLASAGGRAR